MDFMNELLNCLNSIDYDTFDEDTLNELLDSRDSPHLTRNGVGLMKK